MADIRLQRYKTRLLRNRWLVRLSLSFLVTGIVLTSLLMILVSRTVTGQFIDQTDAANRELLAQTAINIDYTLTDLYTEYYQLWQKDPAIQAALQTAGPEISPDLDQKLTEELHFSTEQLMLVRSAHLISYRLDRVWSSNAAPTDLAGQPDTSADPFLNDVATQYDTYRKDIFFARKTRYAGSTVPGATTDAEVDNLTFFFASRSADTANRPFNDVLLINIDRDAFSQLIQQHTDTGFILLVSPSGEIVSDTSQQWTGHVLNDLVTNTDHFPRMRESAEQGGSFLAATAIGRSLVTWQKASSMDFFLIDIMPLASVYAQVNLLNRQIVFYFLAAMLLSLLIGLLSVRYLYKPLQNLLDRIGPIAQSQSGLYQTSQNQTGNEHPGQTKGKTGSSHSSSFDEFAILDAAYQHFALREQQQLLVQLLHGIPPESSLAMKSAYPAASLDLPLPDATAWLALTLMPVQEKGLTLEQTVLLGQTIQEKLGHITVVTQDDMIHTLLPLKDEQMIHTIRTEYETLLNEWQASGQPALVCGLGAPVENPVDARISHRQAIIAANQARLVVGDQTHPATSVFTYNDFASGQKPSESNLNTPASQAKTLVAEHLANPNLSIDQIASTIGLSNGYLRQLFKQETGQTLNDYIIESRIQRACELLVNTSQTGREIARATGFNDVRYFYTLFKKRTGMTIEHYRRSKTQAHEVSESQTTR